MPATAVAQTPAPPAPGAGPAQVRFGILDNSFLVEEAFNQEAGIFQNIFGFRRTGKEWDFAFTQEWPLKSQKHQFSYTLPFAGAGSERGFGDVMLNYRWQATMEGAGVPAFSPRLSLILPTGSSGFTSDAPGLQVNLPVSKQRGSLYFHGNAGFTWFPRVDTSPITGSDGRASLLTPHVSGSVIYGVRPMFNLMLESVAEFEQFLEPSGSKGRETSLTVSPGVRGGWNIGDRQLILGAAVPITWGASDSNAGILLYLSYELPFRK